MPANMVWHRTTSSRCAQGVAKTNTGMVPLSRYCRTHNGEVTPEPQLFLECFRLLARTYISRIIAAAVALWYQKNERSEEREGYDLERTTRTSNRRASV